MGRSEHWHATMRVVVTPTGRGQQVALCVNWGDDNEYVLDYYDTAEEGVAMAQHFTKCYEKAAEEGFYLIPGFFVHDAGYGLTVAEALDKRVSPSQFKGILKSLKTGRHVSRKFSY
ncbi:MAG: hypothetical protein K6T81_12825 [Alicyclobacillus macrosporangiidus]|uniref:hypothetical protein n=1 Tax=Alicyclobacillus macrosporangiidus TaxID=392015 RepID=UPI0026EAEA80|nr:hypothetical protein [Alicyclobacillus macrosporangiidus]MCL6599606.1 hypothetical protein [Alicyclobacillus macrosporangiidus]